MGMGQRRGGRGGRFGRKKRGRFRAGRLRLRRGGRGRGGLAKLILMCCGDMRSPEERQREEIMHLHMTQQMMLMSLNQQGGTVMYTTCYQPGAPLPPEQQYAGAYGTQQPIGQVNAFAPTQYGASGSTAAPYGGVGTSNAVAPAGPLDEAVIQAHQEQQKQLLNEIMAQQSVEKNPMKVNALAGQYNELIQQMRGMEAAGYSYPDGIPPPITMVENPQYSS
ncbi:hypothetical protein ACF0H5_018268 [Mactra antiquata]